MKAMILAAGLGTRLRPWTLHHPKALVPVEGIPMLERVIRKLKKEGFDEIVVNVHHFSDQIIDFLKKKDFGVAIKISDETDALLDTGGGLLRASGLFGNSPVLVHNVDILSNTDLSSLMKYHRDSGNDITLLTSNRESGRKLIFSKEGKLRGWHNLSSGQFKLDTAASLQDVEEEAFSGIYVMGSNGFLKLNDYAKTIGTAKFPIMDFLLSFPEGLKIGRKKIEDPVILDIGKPESLAQAADYLKLIETD